LGIPAEDYDIQNNFGETDHTDDLFKAIEDAYDDKPSLFDNITPDDLILAFFPCIFFCQASQSAFTYTYNNYQKMDIRQKTDKILERSRNREYFYSLLIRLFGIVQIRGLRMIVENPYSGQHYLVLAQNFVMPRPLSTTTDKDGVITSRNRHRFGSLVVSQRAGIRIKSPKKQRRCLQQKARHMLDYVARNAR
jgi:hypothetical protein